MEFTGLSTDQAPPISAPFRFFLTAPLFGVLAGVFVLLSDSTILMSRYSIDSIVVTHAMTIGFLAFMMLGSITQMLPVLAGAKIPKVHFVATTSHALLTVGTLFMLIGLVRGNYFLEYVAFFCLGIGFMIILTALVIALKGVVNYTPTVRGIATSVFFAFFYSFYGALPSFVSHD